MYYVNGILIVFGKTCYVFIGIFDHNNRQNLPGLISSARNVARICDKNLLCARISDEGDRPEKIRHMLCNLSNIDVIK